MTLKLPAAAPMGITATQLETGLAVVEVPVAVLLEASAHDPRVAEQLGHPLPGVETVSTAPALPGWRGIRETSLIPGEVTR